MTGVEGAHIDQLLKCLRPTIGSCRIDKPEHEQRGKFEIGSGCRGAQTLPLFGSQFITLHDHNPIEWGIDCSRGTPCRFQHDVNLLFFDWSPRLKITNGPTVSDHLFEFHWASSINCEQTLTVRSFVAPTMTNPYEDRSLRRHITQRRYERPWRLRQNRCVHRRFVSAQLCNSLLASGLLFLEVAKLSLRSGPALLLQLDVPERATRRMY